MLSQFIAGAIETTLDKVLPLDPDLAKKMAPLADKAVQVELTQPELTLTFIGKPPQLLVAGHYETQVNAKISGTLADFFALGTSRDKQVIGSNLKFEGEIGTAQAFQRFWEQLDIDWEEQLASVIGDIPAHQLFLSARHGAAWLGESAKTVRENLQEYLHHEAMMTPTPLELDNLFADIADLKADVERAEARLTRYLSTRATDKESV